MRTNRAAITGLCALCLGLGAASPRPAHAQLPSYAYQGFPLETLDPTPAGDRFQVAPDARIQTAPVSFKIVGDLVVSPLTVHATNDQGATVTASSSSVDWYTHVGLSAAPWDYVLFSADLPIVLSQGVTLDSPGLGLTGPLGVSPSPGDVGDTRLGVRVNPHLPPWDVRWLQMAFSADFWLTTGNPASLTGDPSNRIRGLIILSGDHECGSVRFDYAGAIGASGFTSSVTNEGHAWGMPLRAALAVALHRVAELRTGLELFANVSTGTDPIDRNTTELLWSTFLPLSAQLTIGASLGHGFAQGPGDPGFRSLLSLQYQTLPNEPKVVHYVE